MTDVVYYFFALLLVIYKERIKMDLQKQARIIDGIHDTLNSLVGQRLSVRENLGRSKIVEGEGVLTQVHPRLFIMEIDRKRGRSSRKSFQFADVLTGVVKLTQNGQPVFGAFVEEEEEEAPDFLDEIAFEPDFEEEKELETVVF